ncbi:MAG: hypothetical protein JW908_00665 [Anaerolineales bacterium]|nr:hypothetical protein [Anaerolineales bacterium]
MDKSKPKTQKLSQETQPEELKRYWVSWWSRTEGRKVPPFQTWISGEREKSEGVYEQSLCAVIDAESEAEIWKAVKKHFPDYEQRFCESREMGWRPGARFPGFEDRTKLV